MLRFVVKGSIDICFCINFEEMWFSARASSLWRVFFITDLLKCFNWFRKKQTKKKPKKVLFYFSWPTSTPKAKSEMLQEFRANLCSEKFRNLSGDVIVLKKRLFFALEGYFLPWVIGLGKDKTYMLVVQVSVL